MHIGKLCLISFVNGTLWLGLSNASDAFKNAEKLQDGLDKTEIVLMGRFDGDTVQFFIFFIVQC